MFNMKMNSMKYKRYLMIPVLAFMSANTYAYTECKRPISRIWNSLSEVTTVWVAFSDGGSPIAKSEPQLTEGQMSRFYSSLLTAQAQNKTVTVRYPEDGLVCPPTGSVRNDVLGVWINGQ